MRIARFVVGCGSEGRKVYVDCDIQKIYKEILYSELAVPAYLYYVVLQPFI